MVSEKYWRDKKVFLTGGTGSIGKNLIKELLNLKAKVFFLSQNKEEIQKIYPEDLSYCKYFFGDLTEEDIKEKIKKILTEHQITNVFHLAAQAIPRNSEICPTKTIELNLEGTKKVLDACKEYLEEGNSLDSIIVASSINAYGIPKRELPLTEDIPFEKGNAYDESKAAIDLLSQEYGKKFGLPIGITRCSNIFGEGDLNIENRIIPKLIHSILTNKEFFLFGGGNNKRGFFYVKDAVFAYLNFSEKMASQRALAGEAFNFGPDSPSTLNEIIKIIIKISEKSYAKVFSKESGVEDQIDLYHDSTRAKTILGWSPQYSLEEGLKETFKWYSNYFNKNGS